MEKHLWKLPIPEYDANNELHARLSQLGLDAEQECREWLDKLVALNGKEWLTVERARSTLRNGWQQSSDTARAIEEAVGELLSPQEAQASPGTGRVF